MVHDLRARIDAVWRIESAKIIGSVARLVRDVGTAEDVAQDALVTALERWPRDGLPDNPAAWLMTVARNKALDLLRRQALLTHKHDELGADAQARGDGVVPDFVDGLDAARSDDIGDDLLRLIFTACHPVLSREAQTALTLKLLGGLSTADIARATLVPEPTVAQRIVRAKKTLSAARVPFEVPQAEARVERLAAVFEVIYLIFNEGYAATRGAQWTRASLCEEAMRLARVLAQLVPQEPEVHGLQALLELQASRLRTRTDAAGRPILLLDQDRSQWDWLLIERGLAALERALVLSAEAGPYTLQAAIAACHARARHAQATDWNLIADLYGQLARQMPSPVVELNRAVAVGMAHGPQVAWPLVEALHSEPSLQRYAPLFAARGDLLDKLGRQPEAQAAFRRAAELTANEAERAWMLQRAERCAPVHPTDDG